KEEEERETPLCNFAAWIRRDVVEDDGAEQRRYVEGAAWLAGEMVPFRVLAAQFDMLQWVAEQLGPTAVVYPGQGPASHVRAAVRLLSQPARAAVYARLGWRRLGDVLAYLHAGGAIGPDGPLSGVEARPPETLTRYVLPAPPRGHDLVAAIRASLGMLAVGPWRVTLPLLAGVYRAPLGPV